MSKDENNVLIEFLKEFVNILPVIIIVNIYLNFLFNRVISKEKYYTHKMVYTAKPLKSLLRKYDLMHYTHQDIEALTLNGDSSNSTQYGTAVLASANER